MYWKLATRRGRNTKGTKMSVPLVLVVFLSVIGTAEAQPDWTGFYALASGNDLEGFRPRSN
jgi:hypothetical protein